MGVFGEYFGMKIHTMGEGMFVLGGWISLQKVNRSTLTSFSTKYLFLMKLSYLSQVLKLRTCN